MVIIMANTNRATSASSQVSNYNGIMFRIFYRSWISVTKIGFQQQNSCMKFSFVISLNMRSNRLDRFGNQVLYLKTSSTDLSWDTLTSNENSYFDRILMETYESSPQVTTREFNPHISLILFSYLTQTLKST